MDQLPRLGKRELICLLLFTCNYVVSVWRGFLFLWVLVMGYVILLWHSLSLPYNYFASLQRILTVCPLKNKDDKMVDDHVTQITSLYISFSSARIPLDGRQLYNHNVVKVLVTSFSIMCIYCGTFLTSDNLMHILLKPVPYKCPHYV